MRVPRKYLLECIEHECGQTRWGLIAEHSINLLRGPEPACTRWLLDTLIRYTNGEDVLGHKSNTVPVVFCVADYRAEQIRKVLADLGVEQQPFALFIDNGVNRLEEHTSELQSHSFI